MQAKFSLNTGCFSGIQGAVIIAHVQIWHLPHIPEILSNGPS